MLNLSEEQLEQTLHDNPALKINKRYSQSVKIEAAPDNKPNKYHNQKVQIDGITFDSKKEAYRYQQLKLMKATGKITGFDIQPKFLLIKGFEKNGKKYRPAYYIADFKVVYPNGNIEIEDTKGFRTKEFNLKQKLFESLYPSLSLKII